MALLGAAAAASLAVHATAALHPFDDAYIILRYVGNVLQGDGAVYSPGQSVFGISCPLYFAWLLLVKAAIPSAGLPDLAARGNAVFLLAAGWLSFRLARRSGVRRWASAAAGAAVMVGEPSLRASIGGMESPLFLALSFGALVALARRKDAQAVLLASLGALTRPEGILLAGLTLMTVRESRGRRRLMILAGLAPLAVWAAWATIQYGSPIPHSIVAKARPLYVLSPGAAMLTLLFEAGRWTLDAILSFVPLPPPICRAAGLMSTLWGLSRWGAVARQRRSWRRFAVAAWLATLLVFYAISNPLLLPWYLPLTYAPWVVVMLGILGLPASRPPIPRAAGLAVGSLAAAAVAASFVTQLATSEQSLVRHGATGRIHGTQLDAYAEAARWIGERAKKEDVVAAAEIGIVGYTLPLRILDGCGLVSPEAIPFLPPPPEERGPQLGPIPVGLIRQEQPAWVMFLPAFGANSLLRSGWFLSNYDLAHEVPFLVNDPRYRAVLIYRRRS